MAEQKLNAMGRTVDGPPDSAEIRLIAELTDCHEDHLAKKDALIHPKQSIFPEAYRELVKAAEIGQAKVETVKVKLTAYRRAKLRKRDLQDLTGLRAAVNDFEGEIDAIFLDNELYREHLEHSPEATAVYQQHSRRLLTIREKLAGLKLVMNSAK